ncbi:unnamed protein product [Camellia sinensis]
MATSAFKSTMKRTPISSPSNAAAESSSSTKPHRRPRSLSLFSGLLSDPPEFAFIQAKCLETGETMAMKKVLQDRRYKNHELQLMRLIDHPNVVSLKHCFFSTRSKDELFLNLVMEYVPKTMYSILKHYSNANQRMPLIYVKLYTYQ